MDLTVIEGGPLPFAFDILTTVQIQFRQQGIRQIPKRNTRLFCFLRGIPGNEA